MENAPKGIANLGNTCYLNACIQVLSQIEPLNNIITKINYIHNPTKIESQLWKQWKEIHFVMQSSGTKDKVFPGGFVASIQSIAKSKKRDFFQPNSQEDITEFIYFFMDCLHECISRPITIQISGHSENVVDNLAINVYKKIKDTFENNYSEITDMFNGVYVSCISSLNNHISHSENPELFSILDLFIPSKDKVTLYDCIDEYCKGEILDGDNMWFNEKTNSKEAVNKYIKFWSFPNILIISLKRVSIDGTTKINTSVEYPFELDLCKYVCGYKKTNFVYDLIGICNHSGSLDNGHYTAFVKRSNDWFFCNDDIIQKVESTDHIITPYGYCLFYVKKNTTV